ncbi:hypothetical protein PHAMO_490004 [Magnetospirillum molischianum DSM 120]|uniref:Uncharacterized protein n=1 Tax=Magnetospirillum molischianum DSM 120 TaxID=1150626 RepID=H8FWV3_MAGML|nr:hypothetical protein PHAMO_490004 [Magnetospirillum molischianum DSM 120]
MPLSGKPTLPLRPDAINDPARTRVATQPYTPAGAHHSARRGYSFRGGPFRWAITSDRLIPWWAVRAVEMSITLRWYPPSSIPSSGWLGN